jgi:hypothetical protein
MDGLAVVLALVILLACRGEDGFDGDRIFNVVVLILGILFLSPFIGAFF